ncbi:site-specific integrase [Pseudomonas germanica]|uniref:site-specific integrase n=1 Tax=Pseudomonas germanica TaxID=2815720 RepID=UPI002A4E2D06|nr:site-specific integrase [Pseudomonas germanica]WPN73654.1 site-specific integrase [Pseudomonas germanica]
MSVYVNQPTAQSSAVESVTESITDSVVAKHWELLRYIESRWGDKKVSSLSTFSDNEWDLRKEGSPYRYNFDGIVGSDAMTHYPMRMLLKSLAFSLLGHTAIIQRSPRTVYNILSAAKPLITWLVDLKCLAADAEGGYFKLPRDITLEEFSDFFKCVNSENIHQNSKWDRVRLLSEWWHLSGDEGVLPSFLKLACDPFDGKKLVDHGVSSDNDKPEPKLEEESGWQPIPLEYAFPLANEAADYIERYAEPLIRYYMIVYEGVLANKNSNGATQGAVTAKCEERGLPLEMLATGLPFEFKFNKYVTPSDCSSYTYKLDVKLAEKSLAHMKRAAVTIVLFTTGMRSSEVSWLEVGCCVPDYSIGVENFYRMTVTVRKTSKEYQAGQIITIPVPYITYLAVRVLEKLGSLKRRGNYLVAPLQSNEKSDHVTGPVNVGSILNYVKGFAQEIGSAYIPHPQQFRKTIAGWFVLNSPVLGPLLVMRLFSHKSLAMTEMYLRNNPLIQEARQEMLAEQSLNLIHGISRSAQAGKLAGVSGERIKAGMLQDPLFEGITGDKLGTTIEEYLRERALHGSMHFLLTPLAVCMFDPEDEDEKPCTQLIAKSGGEGVQSFDSAAAGGLPIVNNCVGVKCDRCLITQCESKSLDQSLGFYSELIGGAVEEDYASNLHLMSSAQEFVHLYSPVLESVR